MIRNCRHYKIPDHGGHHGVEGLLDVDQELDEGRALAVGDALRPGPRLHQALGLRAARNRFWRFYFRRGRGDEAVPGAADGDGGPRGPAEEGVTDEQRHVAGEGFLEHYHHHHHQYYHHHHHHQYYHHHHHHHYQQHHQH